MTDYQAKIQIRKVANFIERELEDFGLKRYYEAKTGSIYLRFRNKSLGSVRVGDHEGKEKYRFKWNIRADVNHSKTIIDRGIERFFFSFKDTSAFVKKVKSYAKEKKEMEALMRALPY